MRRLAALAALASLAALAGCVTPDPAGTAGIVNPASQFCVDAGGTLSMRMTPTGEDAMCTLPNGRVVEEWAFYREAGQG